MIHLIDIAGNFEDEKWDNTLWILYIIAVVVTLIALKLSLWRNKKKEEHTKYVTGFDPYAMDEKLYKSPAHVVEKVDGDKTPISVYKYRILPNKPLANGDKIKITWLPNNNREPNAYIGMEGIVKNLGEDGFILVGDTSSLIIHDTNFEFRYI